MSLMVAMHTSPNRVTSSHVAPVSRVTVATSTAIATINETGPFTSIYFSICCTRTTLPKFAIVVLMVFHLCALWFVLHCDMCQTKGSDLCYNVSGLWICAVWYFKFKSIICIWICADSAMWVRASTSVDANLSYILHEKSYFFYFTYLFLQNIHISPSIIHYILYK